MTVPVEIYAAIRASQLRLRTLGPDGTPLARQYVCPEDGRVLSAEDIERGFETAPDEFVVVTDEELRELAPRRSRDIALEHFVAREAIDPAYFERGYFLMPAGEPVKAYSLLAETMERSGRAAVASFVLRGRAQAVAILADRGLLRAETLRFGDELRTPGDVGLPEPPEEVERAREEEMARCVEALAEAELDESELEDERSERLLELAREKRERGVDVVETSEAAEDEEEGGAQVVDLMALLRQRMEEAPERRRAGPRKVRPRAGKAGERDALEEASRQELYERARALGIPGRSKMKREELLDSLRRAG